MADEQPTRLHVHLKGRVQGVGFRYFVQRTAGQTGVTGWVRNRWDGSVEVLAEGPRAVLDQFLGAVRRGPPGAHVTGAHPAWEDGTGEFTGFKVLRTG